MNEQEAQNWAREYARMLGYCENTVSKVQVRFREKTRNLGRCYIARKLIILNKRFCLERSNDSVCGLIAHEVSHFKAHGHNKKFRQVLSSINPDALRMFEGRNIDDYEKRITTAMCMFDTEVSK